MRRYRLKDIKSELEAIQSYFTKYAGLKKLNAAEELLYVYIGMINSELGGFTDAFCERTGLDGNAIYLILDDYTLEVGSVVAALMSNIGEIIHSEDRELVKNELGDIAQKIIAFMDEDKSEILQKLIENYRSEYQLFKKSASSNQEIVEMLAVLEKNSQLLDYDLAKIDTISKENHYAFVALLLQDVFMLMGLVSLHVGNDMDILSQEEYEDEEFDIKEKMAQALKDARNSEVELYDKADFAYSTTDKVVCNICHGFYAPSGIQRHVGACAKKYVEADMHEKKSSYLFKIYDKYMSDYFLHVLVCEDTSLEELDTFLRDIWLECCGHMSVFRQGRHELEMDNYVVCLTDAKKTEYTYDFGSSTNLIIEFKKEFQGSQEHLIKLLARNAQVKVNCHRCDKKLAKYICTECMYGGDEVLFCEDCVKKHTKKYHEGESYMISHFVNSPRTGVCEYGAMEEEL